MKKICLKLALLLVATVVLVACNRSPSFSSGNSSGLTPTFTQVKSTILDTHCILCHSPNKPQGGVSLSSYDDVMSSPGAVVPFQPHQSQLFWQCYKGLMPEDGPRLSNSELQTLYDWIAYGAPNN